MANPKPKAIEYFHCNRSDCDDLYMTVDGEKIGLAQRPRVPIRINMTREKQGPCPKHRKSLGNAL